MSTGLLLSHEGKLQNSVHRTPGRKKVGFASVDVQLGVARREGAGRLWRPGWSIPSLVCGRGSGEPVGSGRATPFLLVHLCSISPVRMSP